jgi:MFS transporter, PPP family, 3-phenylpropionic acid transporter
MDLTDNEPNQRDLWLMRALYFTALGGTGFIMPFLNLFFTRQGLSGTQIGITASIGSVIAMVVAPLWTSESTRRGIIRQALQVSLALSAVGYLLLGQQKLFLWIILVNTLRILVSAAANPLSDSLAVSVTGATKAGFGSIRVWASLGWAVITLCSGWLIQHTGMMSGFTGAAAMLLTGSLMLFWIRPGYFQPNPLQQNTASTALLDVARGMLHNPAMIGVGLMMIAIGLGNSGVGQFEIVYMNQLGAQEGLLGIAGMVSAAVEIPCMLWADQLVRRRGARWLLSSAMLMYITLRGLVFFFPSVATIIAERAIGGIAFSFYTVALVRFLSEQSTPGERGTVMALFTVTLASLIGIVATPLAGAAFDRIGTHWLYTIAMGGYFLGWLSLRIFGTTAKARPT